MIVLEGWKGKKGRKGRGRAAKSTCQLDVVTTVTEDGGGGREGTHKEAQGRLDELRKAKTSSVRARVEDSWRERRRRPHELRRKVGVDGRRRGRWSSSAGSGLLAGDLSIQSGLVRAGSVVGGR